MPSIPFGKTKKKPDQNAQCFLAGCDAFIDQHLSSDYDKKGKFKIINLDFQSLNI